MATKGFEGTRLPSSREVRRWFAGQAYVRRSKHGARVRSAKSLDSAVLCTLDPDTAVIVTHTEDVADGAGEKTLRSRLIHPVDGWVSRTEYPPTIERLRAAPPRVAAFPRRPPRNHGTSYLRERPHGAPQLVRIHPFSCLHMPTQDRSLVQSRRDRDEFGSELTWTSSS